MVTLTGNHLSLKQLDNILFKKEKVKACTEALSRVAASRKKVEQITEEGRVVYGITTGFGKFSDVFIPSEQTEELQRHLIHSHACGVGEPFHPAISKAMVVLRANALLKGYSGIRPSVIERLLFYVNEDIIPVVPQQGSLGASGDLAPLSHLALTLLGEGEVYYEGERIATAVVLSKLGITPIVLGAKEGLALINGTQAMTAVGVVAYLEAEKIAMQAEKIASLTMEGLNGIIDAFDPDVHRVRGYREQEEVAARMLELLEGSQLVTKQGEKRVQDAYSLRCIPQVHGASWQVLNYVKEKLEIEINAATDNPLIFEDKIISGGNFHGQPIALAMDFLKIGVAELANISERRIERLVNPQLNDLPPFLSPKPGLQSGAMIMQYCAASLVSENKTLAHPASVDSIPSSANQEDHVSMGTIAARHAYQIIQNVRRVLAIEYICALQAVEYRGVEYASPNMQKWYQKGRNIVPSITEDRIFSKDIEALAQSMKEECEETIKN
ncbi:histidine ammonia-lyase [Sutcliffiella cohnii]|uniref:histidine ammonia-lyase n=1 Tax=Sutcliffiella cohnii TaxID=33932 RepID=UPI002E1AC205|nr:histidine ammonia-lyase [Sutcliffiella cohnii]MED4014944.1 histidine ammonia-lyase [Sutcliffiella cohnii]